VVFESCHSNASQYVVHKLDVRDNDLSSWNKSNWNGMKDETEGYQSRHKSRYYKLGATAPTTLPVIFVKI